MIDGLFSVIKRIAFSPPQKVQWENWKPLDPNLGVRWCVYAGERQVEMHKIRQYFQMIFKLQTH